ncbi:efflux RND transporter permease subunit [bacterium]|nr:efflux RND transporter permease subunit [bacterium]
MWLTRTSISRPVFIVMFVLALIVMGFQSKSKMAKELNPNIDIPYVIVTTTYSGAGPSEIESLVSETIEKQLSAISHVKNITSTSQEGTSTVSVEFEMGTDVEAAAADVRDKIAQVKASLPDDADEPKVTKIDSSSMPVMKIGLAGNLTPKEMRILADNTISDRLAKIGGVGAVTVSGGEEREISVAVNKNRLDAYGISISSVVDALSDANTNNPAGSIKEDARDYTVRTVGEFASIQDIANTPIQIGTNTDGSMNVIHVSDIAAIKDTVAEPEKIVRLNGKPSVILTIQKQSGANTVAICDGVKKQFEEMKPILPKGVYPVIATDQSVYVNDSLNDVNKTLAEGVLLVVLIVFLFLHTARATFIVACAIPTSLMATYIPTGAFGFTQNQMVLMALSLVVGILVDDSIVVLENIERHLRKREAPVEAAINGRTEIGLAAITITMVDVVVFLPIAFMGGMTGQFFRQFGVTVAVATLFSLLMSFTLTPMLASKWMKSEDDKERDEQEIMRRLRQDCPTIKDRIDLFAGKLFATLEFLLKSLDTKYRGVLEWALHNRFMTIIIGTISLLVVFAMVMPKSGLGGPRLVIAFIALLCSAIACFVDKSSKNIAITFGVAMAFIAMTIYLPFGFEFFTQTDQSQISITARTPAGTSLKQTDAVTKKIEAIVKQLPEMKTVKYKVSDRVWYNPFSWFRSHMESQTGYCMAMSGSNTMRMSGDSGSQYANISVKVVDKQYRKRSLQEIVDWLSEKTAHIPGTELVTVSMQSNAGPSAGITKEVQGQKMDDVVEEANRVADIMRKIPGLVNIDISYKASTPERRVIVDKYKAAKLGMTESAVARAVRIAIDGDDSVELRENGTEYPIRVHYDLAQRSKASDVNNLIIGTKDGAPIYLSDVAKVAYAFSPNKIEHLNRQKSVEVTANIAGGYSMGNVNQSIEKTLATSPMVTGTTVTSGGSTKMMGESIAAMFAALLLAIVLVYMLMGALFESFLTPFVIMFSLPQAIIGALLALLITGKSMGVTAMIGIIMLIGLVTKNAILLVDYTNTLMSRGKSRNEALLEAGPTRLRPILMTTLAMIGGMTPTALALSQGSESRSPMAIAVIGGLALSTLLTLIVIPVVFTIVDDAWKAFLRKFFPRAYRKSVSKPDSQEHETVLADV